MSELFMNFFPLIVHLYSNRFIHCAAKWQAQFFKQQPTNQVIVQLLENKQGIIVACMVPNIHSKFYN